MKDALHGLGEVAVTWIRMVSGQEDREQCGKVGVSGVRATVLGGEARFWWIRYIGCESEAGDRRLEGKFYILSQEEAF